MRIKRLQTAWVTSVLTVLLSSISFAAGSKDLRLIQAVRAGDQAAVRSLLKEKVDVNGAQPDGATALAWAAHRDDLEVADLLIRGGADVNAANDLGATPLFLASVNGSADMVEKLLKAGANANAPLPSGETPLMVASRAGSIDAVNSLLAHKADVNATEKLHEQTALMWAVANKHSEVARSLIRNGANLHARSMNGYTPLLFAAQEGDLDCVKALLEGGADINEAVGAGGGPRTGDSEGTVRRRGTGFAFRRRAEGVTPGMTPLLVAAARGYEDVALLLLEKGANPNAVDEDGMTALHWSFIKGLAAIAAAYNQLANNAPIFRPNMTRLAKALVEHGADVNARTGKTWQTPAGLEGGGARLDSAGTTPFFLATTTLDLDMMRYLLAHGADPKITDAAGATALHAASGTADNDQGRNAEERQKGLVAARMLLDLGIDLNAVGDLGYTALHGAAYCGDDAMVQLLVDHGARMDIMDEYGQTPLSIAMGVITTGVKSFNLRARMPHPSTTALLVKLGAPSLEESGVEAVVVGVNDARPVNMSHLHMGHVSDKFNTPQGAGLLPTALAEAKVVVQHAGLAAKSPDNLDQMKLHAGHVLHALDPSLEAKGPGLGYGVRPAAAGVIQHIEMAANVEGASANVKTHAVHVATAARNVVKIAGEMASLAKKIQVASTPAEAAALVSQLNTLAEQLISGSPNEAGQIGWQTGGLQQAQQHMELMKKGEGG
jgi:ankyrin repeat protein